MQTGGYVGRVGRLAVALGVGSAVTMGLGCGVAAADPTGSSTSSSSSGSSDSAAKGSPGSKAAKNSKAAKARTKTPRRAKSKTTASDAAKAETAPQPENHDTADDHATTDGTAPTPREAVDKLGATLRTAVRDAMDAVAPSDRDAKVSTQRETKRETNSVQRLLPKPVTPPPTDIDDVPQADIQQQPPEPPDPVAVDIAAITAVPKSVLTSGVHAVSAMVSAARLQPAVSKPVEDVEDAVTTAVSTVINTVLDPFSLNSTPDAPAEPPTAWAMLAFARREFERAFRQPQDLLTQVSTLSTAVTQAGPVALAPGIVVPPELADHVIATPGPSLTDQITVWGMEALKQVSQVIGVNITMKLGELITTPNQPWFTTIGLDVTKDTYAGGDVWVITPPNPTDEVVIAVHGSGFVYDPNIIHWMDYTQMARETGATVVVPRYPLIPDGGTAENSVPQMADFIAAQVQEHGAENVSIYADSAGGTLSTLAVQKIVRDCNGDSGCLADKVPSRMVLLSPGLSGPDIYDDPNVELVNDPVVWLTEEDKEYYGQWSTGPEELWNPMIGPTEGMPPTTIYVASRESSAPGVLLYAQRMVNAGGDVDVVIGMGQIHDWAQGGPIPINSQSANYRADIYRQLGLVDDATNEAATVAAASQQSSTPDAIALAPGIVVPGSLVDNVDTTGPPSLFDQVTVLALTVIRDISKVFGADITMSLGAGIVVPEPPAILTLGLDVRATEFTAEDADGVEQTWQVWEISNPQSESDEHVIAFHGGGLVMAPTLFHWLDYAQMARQTGATVIVPRYPLIPDGGTADNTIPPAVELINSYVTEYGAQNVSVYAESSGGMIALLAVQKIVRDCAGDAQCLSTRVPSRMVLSSPAVTDPDIFTDPNVALVNDPLYPATPTDTLVEWRSQQDPELSDTFLGPVEGLPPTVIYIGSRELLAPAVLKFATLTDDAGSDVKVVVGMGQMHGWVSLPINSQFGSYRDDVYRQLGLVDDATDEAVSV